MFYNSLKPFSRVILYMTYSNKKLENKYTISPRALYTFFRMTASHCYNSIKQLIDLGFVNKLKINDRKYKLEITQKGISFIKSELKGVSNEQ